MNTHRITCEISHLHHPGHLVARCTCGWQGPDRSTRTGTAYRDGRAHVALAAADLQAACDRLGEEGI